MTLPSIHLSLAERREIARMHAAKIPIRVIADCLQRHRSTIYREIEQTLPQASARGLCHGPPQGWMVARADRWPPAGIRCS